MSDREYDLPGRALSPTDQAKGRWALIGYATIFLGLAVAGFAGPHPVRWLGLLAIVIGSAMSLSRPQGTGRVLTPRNIRRIARIAAVPEVGAVIVVYGCLVAGVTGVITNLATN